MRNPLFHFSLALTATILLSTYLLFHVTSIERESRALKASLGLVLSSQAKPVEREPVERADVMEKLQRHSHKLYFAGHAENWDLAAFYLEEITETVKGIKDKDVMEGPINVSGLMQRLILPEVEKLETAVKGRDGQLFQRHYGDLTSSCNACHVAANHPYIVIQQPQAPLMDNQKFEPIKTVSRK